MPIKRRKNAVKRDPKVDKRLISYIAGGGTLTFLITVFTFMSMSPWATKTEHEQTKRDVTRLETELNSLRSAALTEKDLRPIVLALQNLTENIGEIKMDIKEMKEEQARKDRWNQRGGQ